MDVYYVAVNALRMFALSVGSLVILVGIARGVVAARGAGARSRAARQVGEHATLGLDLFVGATLLNLATGPTWAALATTALIIVVRRLLTFSLGLPLRAGTGPPSTGPPSTGPPSTGPPSTGP